MPESITGCPANKPVLLHDKPERPKREHKGKIAVAESDMRWCSDGFEYGCDNGEKLRITFALDCCDSEAIDWAASTGDYDSSIVQDVMLRSMEKRFGNRLPDTAVQRLTDNGQCIAALQDMPDEWKDQYRKDSDDIRKPGLSISDYVQHNRLN
ncbi:hypothetical protein EAE_09045 [Klebsiella aerogenes KCTC 2190]|uniref:Transposase n=1 Tax=Klebsiella aerogenes (strain ATCC 13048 / DSM 30053 / CCUG 1429 / JCM 1235 / KCTC 2190 / NBRC 13534 / NCIMB 10102 / NCTC 10006 / CDC 819-56) TaxID=1028307 RepID=A0A0H3FPW5_KLEAK|nr:hypothetical protein EAE_09045 [Klebsiella aerogenes KCTC 2190]